MFPKFEPGDKIILISINGKFIEVHKVVYFLNGDILFLTNNGYSALHYSNHWSPLFEFVLRLCLPSDKKL